MFSKANINNQIFYEPNADRPNLHLVTDAQATKILTEIHADGVIGTGVEFVKGGNTHVAKASCEVILSAGECHEYNCL